jgi:putative membrane protein
MTSAGPAAESSKVRPLKADAEKLAQSAKHMEKSAGTVAHTTVQLTDSADRRTELAADRTLLAAERTYAAWVRTGLAALASGVGAPALLGKLVPGWLVGTTGSVLVLFSTFCFVAAVWRQLGYTIGKPEPDAPRLPSAILIAVNGFLVIVTVFALIGIWGGLIRPA